MVCVLLAAYAFSSGCATAINGMTQRVAVASDPPSAQVYVNDAPAGVTPAFVDVPRRDPDLKLRLEKEGYAPAVLAPECSRSGWMAGNVLFAGVPINEYTLGMWVGAMAMYGALGWLRDAKSGGAYNDPIWYARRSLLSHRLRTPRTRKADATRHPPHLPAVCPASPRRSCATAWCRRSMHTGSSV